MSDNCGSTWPEQDAIDSWFKAHDLVFRNEILMVLKKAVTQPRIEAQDQLNQSQLDLEQANKDKQDYYELYVECERATLEESEAEIGELNKDIQALNYSLLAEAANLRVAIGSNEPRKAMEYVADKLEELANKYKDKQL